MRLLPVIAIISAITLANACAKPHVTESDENGFEVTLYHCGSFIPNSEVRICFDSLLSDSRCPIGMDCVWMGVGVGKFSLSTNGATYPFKLATTAMPYFGPKDTIVAGYKIELINLSPYPGTMPEPIPDNVRKAELKVTKL